MGDLKLVLQPSFFSEKNGICFMHFSARLCALSIRSPKLFKIATSKNRTVQAELQNDI